MELTKVNKPDAKAKASKLETALKYSGILTSLINAGNKLSSPSSAGSVNKDVGGSASFGTVNPDLTLSPKTDSGSASFGAVNSNLTLSPKNMENVFGPRSGIWTSGQASPYELLSRRQALKVGAK